MRLLLKRRNQSVKSRAAVGRIKDTESSGELNLQRTAFILPQEHRKQSVGEETLSHLCLLIQTGKAEWYMKTCGCVCVFVCVALKSSVSVRV